MRPFSIAIQTVPVEIDTLKGRKRSKEQFVIACILTQGQNEDVVIGSRRTKNSGVTLTLSRSFSTFKWIIIINISPTLIGDFYVYDYVFQKLRLNIFTL